MANVRSLARSFAGGEVTPEFYGRIDDAKYQTGLAVCRNFVVAPHGPAFNRAGFGFTREVRDSANRTCVRPFSYSTTQTMVLELGEKYMRFHTQGASLLAGMPAAYNNATAYAAGDLVSSGGAIYYCTAATTGNAPPNVAYWYVLPASGVYEIPTPYSQADVFDIHWVQSADVLTLTHPSYKPKELRRLGAAQWVLSDILFASSLTPPTGISATATSPSGGATKNHTYVVTALGGAAVDESLPSTSALAANNLAGLGNYNTVAWSAVTGATRYNVYKLDNGLYGFVGQTGNLSFVDDNIAPDLSQTPPENVNPFNAAGTYPGAVSYYEQRRCFAGSLLKPQNFWATRSGTENNLQFSIPTRDDDSIQFRIAAREANTIRHIVPLSNLILLTSSVEWRVTSVNTDALTPTSFSVKPQSFIGANNVQPVVVNNNLLFAAARGGHLREMAYAYNANGYVTGDISLRAPHLFDGFDLVDMAYAKSPLPVVWAVSSSGKLLGLTYVPEEDVGAWHQHVTDGVFESCCTVAEGAEDMLYAVIRRTIGGVQRRYVERMASRAFTDRADAFFVDAGLTYSGAPATVISGLTHLEGKTVSILADGSVRPQQVVTGGAVTLDQAASKASIGLPYNADLQTLPLSLQIDGFGQGRMKNVNKVWLRLFASGGLSAGPSFDKLKEAKLRTTEAPGSPPDLRTGEVEIVLPPGWDDSAAVCVRVSDPLPATIVSLTLEAAIGG